MGLGEMAVSQAGRAETFFWKGIEALGKGFSFLLSGSMSQKHPAPKFRAHSAGPCTPSSCHTPWGGSPAISAVPEATSSYPSGWLVSGDICVM